MTTEIRILVDPSAVHCAPMLSEARVQFQGRTVDVAARIRRCIGLVTQQSPRQRMYHDMDIAHVQLFRCQGQGPFRAPSRGCIAIDGQQAKAVLPAIQVALHGAGWQLQPAGEVIVDPPAIGFQLERTLVVVLLLEASLQHGKAGVEASQVLRAGQARTQALEVVRTVAM